jgi:alpha-L-fucosidase 2
MQVDGSFGVAAAVAEMLLQSHEGELSFLPALPAAWGDGAVEGLCARGGFEVSFSWKKGVLSQAKIISKLGKTCRIRTERQSVLETAGKQPRMLCPKEGVVEFKTSPGQTYTLSLGVGALVTREMSS